MATKSKTIQVVRHKEFEIQPLGSRSRKSLLEDISDAANKGYKIVGMKRHMGHVFVQMGLTEDWSIDEVMTEIDELLDR